MRELSYLDAIREALAEEMRRDPKVFVLGEDVGPYGGAFGATQGLYEEFGELRVVDTPISEAAVPRDGGEITVVTYGAMVMPSLEAGARMAKEGVEVEVIDLRTLMPYDKPAIFRSIEKTNRALIFHEDVKTLGIGAEL